MVRKLKSLVIITTPYFTDRLHETQQRIGDAGVPANESASNLGVIFDTNLDMSNHIKTVCRSSFTQLRPLRSIKYTLTHDSLEKVTHAFIGSRLHYCNALMYGLLQSSIGKLQWLPRC